MKTTSRKLLIINNIPTPYRTYMFNLLHEYSREFDIQLIVAFQAKTERKRDWKPGDFNMKFNYYYSQSPFNISTNVFSQMTFCPQILRDIVSGCYDWICFSPSMSLNNYISAFLPTKSKKILWTEENEIRYKHKNMFLKWVYMHGVKHFQAIAVPGDRQKEFLHKFFPGLRNKPVLRLPNLVDDDFFGSLGRNLVNEKERIRKELRIPDSSTVILMISRLVLSKGIHHVINAVKNVKGDYIVIILGEGPLKKRLLVKIKENHLEKHVRLEGHVKLNKIIEYLASADWFLHAAEREPYGMACIEALKVGLPLAISKQTGGVPELIDGNGFTFDATNEVELQKCLEKIVHTSEQTRQAFCAASIRIADDYFDSSRACKTFFRDLIENVG